MSAVLQSHQNFDIRSERTGDTVRLHLSGEIDMGTATVLEAWLSQAECDPDWGIFVDLEKVTFMDSSGVHVFLRAADRASQSGSQFAIVNASPIVERVFQLTRSGHLLS